MTEPHDAAEAGGGALVVKDGRSFLFTRTDGDIRAGSPTGEGLYADDTRYLSLLRVRLGSRAPVLLSSSAENAHEAVIDLTNPELDGVGDSRIPKMTLSIRRERLMHERLYERVEVRNHGRSRAETELELVLDADFADVFEVRRIHNRRSRGRLRSPKPSSRGVDFAYVGEDEELRQTFVESDPPADVRIDEGHAVLRWPVFLDPQDAFEVTTTIEPSPDGRRAERRPMDAARSLADRSFQNWLSSCARIKGLHPTFNRVVEASIRDLKALISVVDGRPIMAAGIPWYVAAFGRDALITCYEMLMLNPDPARAALRFLAGRQATFDDPERDAEPGKVLHELRVGELARAGHIPHTPYFGSVDSTPLFLMLAGAYFRWTADLETLSGLLPALDAALAWMDHYGDQNGDGFLDYKKRSPGGLYNQGWKDSDDSVIHHDGTVAEPPLALVEVQGYAYLAKRLTADVFEALGLPDRTDVLRKDAARLKEAFNEAFWMEDEGTFALALDHRGRQVRSIASNPGHCLYCGIVDEAKAPQVAERLIADDMFSGWGIRTLSSDSPSYNPLSYHNGSVWPHDNAIVSAGLKRYGFVEATEKIVGALFEAALVSPEARLPELFCGFRRRPGSPYVSYPVACRPQAWAAAAPIMMLQALLGISAQAPEALLRIDHPEVPKWLGRIELRNLRVGRATVGIALTRSEGATEISRLDREGDVRVSIHQE